MGATGETPLQAWEGLQESAPRTFPGLSGAVAAPLERETIPLQSGLIPGRSWGSWDARDYAGFVEKPQPSKVTPHSTSGRSRSCTGRAKAVAYKGDGWRRGRCF